VKPWCKVTREMVSGLMGYKVKGLPSGRSFVTSSCTIVDESKASIMSPDPSNLSTCKPINQCKERNK